MMNRTCAIPIPPRLTVPNETDKRRVKIIPLIKVFNIGMSTNSTNQPQIFAPSAPMTPRSPSSSQRLAHSLRSPLNSSLQRTTSQIDQIFDIIKNEKFDDPELNNLISRLDQRLQALFPRTRGTPYDDTLRQRLSNSRKKEEMKAKLIVEKTLCFECTNNIEDDVDDPRDKEIERLEENLKAIAKMIQARFQGNAQK